MPVMDRVGGSASDYNPPRHPADRRNRRLARAVTNTARKGNAAERYVAKWLAERGWLVASRRHIGGAGDLLAVRGCGDHFDGHFTEVWLVEVKATKSKSVWEQFRREDRKIMAQTPLPEGGERWLVNVRGKELQWFPESSWPTLSPKKTEDSEAPAGSGRGT